MNQPTFRDVELLSAYLDGQLSQADSTRLETRLKTNPQLRTVFDELSQSRALLRQLPARRAPRNFTLTPKMAGVKPPIPRAFPLFRFASALAAILLFFSYAANLTLPALSNMRAAAPAPVYGIGGGNQEPPAMEAAPAAPMAAATQAPAMVPAATAEAQDAAPTPTGEEMRTTASPETPYATETPAVSTPAATEVAPVEPAQGKMAPTEQRVPVVSVAPEVQPPVPVAVEIFLLVVALLAGAIALFLRWQADRKFSQTVKRK
jgi:anti-sigma factor RsiW